MLVGLGARRVVQGTEWWRAQQVPVGVGRWGRCSTDVDSSACCTEAMPKSIRVEFGTNHDVRWFDIAVNHVATMHVIEGAE